MPLGDAQASRREDLVEKARELFPFAVLATAFHRRGQRFESVERREFRLQLANPTGMKKPPDFGQGNYPKDLEELTKPIELNNSNYVRLLRERDLIDPMTGKSDWIRLGLNDDSDKTDSNTEQVFEVHSSSPALALDGKTHYNEW